MINELSIIIPTYNEEHYLAKTLRSIQRQKLPSLFETIIVDGYSEDKTLQVAKSFQNKIHHLSIVNTKRGTGHQRNVGAHKAKYKYVLFLDADIILSKNLIPRLMHEAKSDEDFISMVTVWTTSKNFSDNLLLALCYPFIILFYLLNPTPGAGFIFTTKHNHKKINGFNEKAILGEDADYGTRSLKAGAKPHFYFSFLVFHSARRAEEMGFLQMLFFWAKTYLYIKKYGPVIDNKKFNYPYGHYKGISS